MGKEVGIGALVGGLPGAIVGENYASGRAQKLAIKRQMIQEKMKRSSDQINADQKMETMVGKQIAESSGSGFTYGGSVANLTASNIQKFGQDTYIKNLSSQARLADMNVQYHQVMKNTWINTFKEGLGLASTVAEIAAL